jgi:hypothetical protein
VTARRAVVVAVVLWVVFAVVVWNAVFDRMVVLAGRRYAYHAAMLYRTTGRYLLIDQAMRPAVAHAARVASLAGGVVLLAGVAMVGMAARREKQRSGSR